MQAVYYYIMLLNSSIWPKMKGVSKNLPYAIYESGSPFKFI